MIHYVFNIPLVIEFSEPWKNWKMKIKLMKLLHGATVGIYYRVGTELAGEEKGCYSFLRIGKKYPG